MNILVTGANGQLGREMRIVARDSAHKYLFTDVCDGYEHLDITDLDAVRAYVKANDIRCIVNCAAWTNVDGAEDPAKYPVVEALNATAPGYLATAMAEVGGLLVHISTDYVFGGDPYNTPCREDQKGKPTGVYGLTKLHGEQAIERVFAESRSGGYIIIRTGWLYSEYGKNFVKTMLHLTATKPQLKVVFDQAGTPTYALDLARAIAEIIRQIGNDITPPSAGWGTYHYSNEGVCSWYDFTKMIYAQALDLGVIAPGACDIQPCHSDEFPSAVRRPAYSVLDKTKIKQTFSLSIPYWTDSLRCCLRNLTAKEGTLPASTK